MNINYELLSLLVIILLLFYWYFLFINPVRFAKEISILITIILFAPVLLVGVSYLMDILMIYGIFMIVQLMFHLDKILFYKLGILMLLICLISLLFRFNNLAEYFVSWSAIFIIFGTIKHLLYDKIYK